MGEAFLGIALLVYAGGIVVAGLSSLCLNCRDERKALQGIALLWPACLAAALIVLGGALCANVASCRSAVGGNRTNPAEPGAGQFLGH
jgi:NADH:ubiquinone oxidoreductase subunit 6 (subunit J)